MSEVRTEPKRLVDLNPKWVTSHDTDEVYGIRHDCPCGKPGIDPQYDEHGNLKVGADGKVLGWELCCPMGGWCVVPTKANFIGLPTCADSLTRGWDVSGDSFENITLSPSIHHVGHWHGFLRNGLLESC